jgi:aminoacylase
MVESETKNASYDKIHQVSGTDAEPTIARFQQFLKFETVSATASSTGAYKECARFLKEELESLSALSDVHYLEESPDHSPVVVAKWKGKDESLPVLLLNSHYDVVPADISKWTVPAFEGLRKEGKIYGRGSQDMKCVCMQYIEAIRTLTKLHPEWKPERNIYLTFVPDEEFGGGGMAAFLDSKLYKSIPGIALALDEGLASTTNTFDVFYGERLRKFQSMMQYTSLLLLLSQKSNSLIFVSLVGRCRCRRSDRPWKSVH